MSANGQRDLCTGGMYLGTLRGYRSWRVSTGGELRSIRGTAWEQESVEARCIRLECDCPVCTYHIPDHAGKPAPQADCECGIYGWYTWEKAASPYAVWPTALGVIEASGRIIVGTEGFRAEKATVIAIVFNRVPSGSPISDLDILRSRYPSIKIYGTHMGLLADYPEQDVTELIA